MQNSSLWRKQNALGTAADSAVLLPVQVQAEDGLCDEVQSIARPSLRTVKRDVSVSLIEIEVSGVLVRLRGTVDDLFVNLGKTPGSPNNDHFTLEGVGDKR